MVRYVAPGCKRLEVRFDGNYAPDTARYKTTCVAPCTVADASFSAPSAQLDTTEGTIDAVADTTLSDEPNFAERPPVEGFTLCDVELTVNDGVFAGRHFDRTIGHPC